VQEYKDIRKGVAATLYVRHGKTTKNGTEKSIRTYSLVHMGWKVIEQPEESSIGKVGKEKSIKDNTTTTLDNNMQAEKSRCSCGKKKDMDISLLVL